MVAVLMDSLALIYHEKIASWNGVVAHNAH